MFLLAEVAVICTDQNVLPNELIRKSFVYLADATYWMHYGDPTEETKKKASESLERFHKTYFHCYGMTATIPKEHEHQHFDMYLRWHGLAYCWDSFNLERAIGLLNKSVTTRVNHADQLVTNFLVRFHSRILNNLEEHDADAREYLTDLGYDSSFFVTLSTMCTFESPEPMPTHYVQCIVEYLTSGREEFFDDVALNSTIERSVVQLTRVSRLKFRNQILTSAAFVHSGNVNDSYVQVGGQIFGQMEELCEVDKSGCFVMLVRKYQKIVMPNPAGRPVELPHNQFPVRPTNDLVVFSLNDKLFVQKILLIDPYVYNGISYQFFAIRPNDVFQS